MKQFPLLVLVCWGGLMLHPAGQAAAQNSLLYEISHPDHRKPSYLYGTMHRVDTTFLSCSGFFRQTVRDCEVYSGELDFDDLAFSQELAEAMLLNDAHFSDLFTEEEYAFVMTEMTERWGPLASSMERLKPFWLASMWATDSPEAKFDPGLIVDVRLQRIAEEEMLTRHPLETVEEQLAAIDRIGMDEQADFLLEVMRDSTSIEKSEALFKAYSSGNLDEIELIYKANRLDSGVEEALITARNKTMVTRLQGLLERDVSVFCAVGALHLIGDTGLIARLREMGYTLKVVHYLPCD